MHHAGAPSFQSDTRSGSGEPEDEFASQSYLPAVIRVSLTRVADDFDEVDFSVNHEIGHEDPSLEHTCPSNGRERTPSKTHVYNSRAVSGRLHSSRRCLPRRIFDSSQEICLVQQAGK